MNTPNIRFKGFGGDWEQRKLGDVCNFINGDRSNNYPSTADFTDSGIPFVGSDALGETLVNKSKLRYISSEKYQQMNGLKIELDDVLYTLRGAGFGKCSIADFSSGTVASSCVGIRCADEIDAKFLVQWLGSPTADNEKNKAVNGSTAQNISVEDMKNYVINAPEFKEQQKISSYLYTIDNLITLYRCKCDSLKQVKKYMLQKMFPKKGEKVPEIRFAGFTGDWEKRKLGEVSDKVTQKNQNAVINEVFTNSAEFGIISQRDFFDKDIANAENIEGYYVVEPDDFVYNPRISTTAPFGPIKRNKLGRTGAMSPLYYVFRLHDIDLSYLEWFFQTTCWYAFMRINGNSGARADRFAITDGVFAEMPICIPQDIEEQRKIGEYFHNIDNLITLHQRKVDSLKQVKKYMLQNMFP